jgi:F0F1-type ATP synthase membrane subunit b/b'
MPQFDFTFYTGQIFWFTICFLSLYFSVKFVIMPRLKSIIDARRSVIDQDIRETKELKLKINEIKTKEIEITSNSNANYQSKIDSTIFEIQSKRDQMISSIKLAIDESNKKSQKDINEFLNKSQNNTQFAIEKIADIIRKKIIN